MRPLIFLLVAGIACAADEKPTKITTIHEFADGRKVVIEETSDAKVPAKAKASNPGCPTCGEKCDCKGCQCDAQSLVYGCQAATDAELAAYLKMYRQKKAELPSGLPVGYTIPPYSGYRGYFDVPQYTTPRSVANGPFVMKGTLAQNVVVPNTSLPVSMPMPPIPTRAGIVAQVGNTKVVREPILPARRAAFYGGFQAGVGCASGG